MKLVEGRDYDSEEGSTKITIRAQTFQKAGSGSHTIAAEFRHGGKNDLNSPLKKTAQVYKANTSGGSNSGSGGSSRHSVNPNHTTDTNTPQDYGGHLPGYFRPGLVLPRCGLGL